MNSIEEGFLTVPGGKVWYRIVGKERPGMPLVTLHGGPGAPHDYLEPLEGLADERPVVFYDQLGCGNSERPDDLALWNNGRFIDELIAVQEGLGLAKIHLLGQSWGTLLAGEYMLREKPRHVCSLIFSGPFFSASRWCADQQRHLSQLPAELQAIVRHAEATQEFESPAYQEAVRVFYNKHVCRLEPWPEAMNRTIEKMGVPVYLSMCGPSEFTMTGSLRKTEIVSRLNEIKVPVLFTCGRYDEAAPETTAIYQQALPGSEMVIIEDASHEHHLEKPQEYLDLVRSFLRHIEGRETAE